MWKEFSRSYLARNPAAGRTVAAAALAAAFFLSLVIGLFYNLWVYEVERIIREEGGWQARVTVPADGPAPEELLKALTDFANVESAALADPTPEGEAVIELTFRRRGRIYADLALIRQALDLPEEAVQAHELLLSRYLVSDPQDPDPPLLLPFLLAVVGAVALALVLLIRNAFAITMQSRLHQFGILSSVGATPRQLRVCLLQEAAVLALIPLAAGTALGLAGCAGVLAAVNAAAADLAGRQDAVFRLHPLVVAGALGAALVTVLVSAWLPAFRLSRMPPLQALQDGAGPQADRVRRRRGGGLLGLVFGVRGELAGCALRQSRRALRVANLSLLLSFLGFTAMLCFFTLSGISTRYTYFERYQDAWDVMARLPDASAEDFARLEPLQTLTGVRSATVYTRADAACRLDADDQSPALQQLGGLGAVAGDAAAPLEEGWLVNAPILVMDDASFLAYCEAAGLTPSLDGAILLNRVWDSLHSNFRDRLYLPFVRGDLTALTLTSPDGAVLGELPLLGCTDTPPALREEYDQYALVQFWPLSLWQSLDWAPAAEPGLTVRLLGPEGITAAGCEALQAAAAGQLDLTGLAYTIENRIAERAANNRMIAGAQAILGAFCLLLAAIGLANVFLNTLGFVGQRRREFARYLALGMTPGELRSLFWIEAAVIAGRPLVITLLLTGGMVAFMLRASYLDPAVFLAEAPVGPVALFAGLIAGAVALAYALGARRVLAGDLTLLLKDDSLR